MTDSLYAGLIAIRETGKYVCNVRNMANWAPVLPGKNLMSLCHLSGHFTLNKVFSSVTHLGFRVWGTTGVQGLGWRGHTCVKNLPRVFREGLCKIGPVIRA